MMTARTAGNAAVTVYLSAVREALADLPPGDLGEIMDDVAEDLEQLAREIGDPVTLHTLIDRLGTPDQYAQELRAAAGLNGPASRPEQAGFFRRLCRFSTSSLIAAAAVSTLLGAAGLLFGHYPLTGMLVLAIVCAVGAAACVLLLGVGVPSIVHELRQIPGAGIVADGMRRLRSDPWGEASVEFVRSLRPAWWVVRAGVVGLLVGYNSNVALGTVAFLAALALSVWLGRKTMRRQFGDRQTMAVQLGNVAVVVGGFALLMMVASSVSGHAPDRVYAYEEDPYHGISEVAYDEYYGLPVQNIFAYGPDGELIRDVRLFDQDGQPIHLSPVEPCYDDGGELVTAVNPWGAHVYPRPTVDYDEFGNCVEGGGTPPYGDRLPGTDATGANASGTETDADQADETGTAGEPDPADEARPAGEADDAESAGESESGGKTGTVDEESTEGTSRQ